MDHLRTFSDQLPKIRDQDMLGEAEDKDEDRRQGRIDGALLDDDRDIEQPFLDDGDADDGIKDIHQEHTQWQEKSRHLFPLLQGLSQLRR